MKQKLCYLFSILSIAIYAQNTTLELNPSLKTQMNIIEVLSGTYDIQTLAGGDPCIQTRPVQTFNPNPLYYIAPKGLDDLQIFYGAPIIAGRRASF